MDAVFSRPVQRSKEYLEALIALGGDLDAIEQERAVQERAVQEDARQDGADHGPGAWGGPRHLRSNWGAGFNNRGRCRRTSHADFVD